MKRLLVTTNYTTGLGPLPLRTPTTLPSAGPPVWLHAFVRLQTFTPSRYTSSNEGASPTILTPPIARRLRRLLAELVQREAAAVAVPQRVCRVVGHVLVRPLAPERGVEEHAHLP